MTKEQFETIPKATFRNHDQLKQGWFDFFDKAYPPREAGTHSFVELWGIFDRYAGETKTHEEIAGIISQAIEEYSEENPSSFNKRNLLTDIPIILDVILESKESANQIFEKFFREDFLTRIQTKAKKDMN